MEGFFFRSSGFLSTEWGKTGLSPGPAAGSVSRRRGSWIGLRPRLKGHRFDAPAAGNGDFQNPFLFLGRKRNGFCMPKKKRLHGSAAAFMEKARRLTSLRSRCGPAPAVTACVGGTEKRRSPIFPPPDRWTLRGAVPRWFKRQAVRFNPAKVFRAGFHFPPLRRLLSHPHPLRWAADGSPASPFPTPIPLKRPSTGGRGPKWSPAKRVHLGEEEQGSGPIFRRQAEIEGSGLCDDDSPSYWKYPPGLFYSNVCKHRRLTPSRRRCRESRCAAAKVEPWAQQQSIFAG